ncbi:unnamed protein product [Caretta caretta]
MKLEKYPQTIWISETRLCFWNCTKFTLQWAAVVDRGGGSVKLWKRAWGAILRPFLLTYVTVSNDSSLPSWPQTRCLRRNGNKIIFIHNKSSDCGEIPGEEALPSSFDPVVVHVCVQDWAAQTQLVYEKEDVSF